MVLISQPEGADCPEFHGVGLVSPDLFTPQGGLNGATVVGYMGPDGELATCTTVLDAGFVTKPAPAGADDCPAPGSD